MNLSVPKGTQCKCTLCTKIGSIFFLLGLFHYFCYLLGYIEDRLHSLLGYIEDGLHDGDIEHLEGGDCYVHHQGFPG